MNNGKLQYVKPRLQYWTAAELDAVEATMSGGSGSSMYYVAIVNNPSFGFGVAGHSAVLFHYSVSSFCELFSFAPADNSSAVYAGSIAGIASDADAENFEIFRSACNAGGVGVVNTSGLAWNEGFTRFIEFGVDGSSYSSMRAKAVSVKNNLPTYKGLSYNCQSFVNEVLSAGGITLQTDLYTSLANVIVPNEVFENAAHVQGAYSMYKDLL